MTTPISQPTPGDPAPTPTTPPPPPVQPPLLPDGPAPTPGQPGASTQGDQLGPAGIEALRKEREARKALEVQLAELAPLRQIAAAIAGPSGEPGQQGDPVQALTDRLAAHEAQLAEERVGRHRAEVAHEQGLTPQQAEWLQGQTREEIAASAERLRAAWGTPAGQQPDVRPGAPRPDLTQGARGTPIDVNSQIIAARQAGRMDEVIRLQLGRAAG